jgi:hypothetical protein
VSSSVPDVPDDWETKETMGAPYLLGVEDGVEAWRSLVVAEVVTSACSAPVTDNAGRAVYVFPH